MTTTEIEVPTEAPSVVLRAYPWNENGDLIADVARLGYLRRDWLTLDPTYERGVWWKRWCPDRLVTNDWDKTNGDAQYHEDFRAMPFEDGMFDAIAFDPPYVCVGGRETSTIPDFHDRFGTDKAPRTPQAVQQQYDDGLAEMYRMVRPSGVVVCKCQNYVWSGKLVLGVYNTTEAALALGFDVVDEFVHIGGIRPQPARKRQDGVPVRQHHARGNCSSLLVLRKPKGKR